MRLNNKYYKNKIVLIANKLGLRNSEKEICRGTEGALKNNIILKFGKNWLKIQLRKLEPVKVYYTLNRAS